MKRPRIRTICGRRQATDADDGAVFAERMSGYDVAPRGSALFEHGMNGGGDGQDGRLRVFRQFELIVRTFETEL
jgi:hypothetical protein